ncbi:MAG TPA: OmpA family protein [Flavobacteriaceae bacterium]|nr:OmpA family protein [Flavobacteriaceae bacterium]
MIQRIIFLLILAVTLNGCVSTKVYQELETKYNQLRSTNSMLIKEKDEILAKNKQLIEEVDSLKTKYNELKLSYETLKNTYEANANKLKNLEESYDALATNNSQKIAEQAAKNQQLLATLEDKELKLAAERTRLEKLQSELSKKGAQIAELQQLIAAKESQMQQLKETISSALHSFEGKGLTVEHKNGKIYVSMENKLLFNSGSWAVGSEGTQAVEKLAVVLNQNPDINVLIEGHTDNVPYSGNTILDNWDLSVKRATAIVRILQNKGVNPKQITAAGRSEYIPLGENNTTAGKAKNRRIEIILAPNLDKISQLLNN